MALSDKDILITPNRGQTADPKIEFKGADDTLGPQTITLQVYPTSNGTLSFEGSAGQLFSITNDLTGTIFSVNDISGIPSIEVLDTGLVKLAEFGGNVLLGTGTDNGIDKIQINGGISTLRFKQPQQSVNGNTSTTTLDFSAYHNFYVTLSTNTTFAFSNLSNNIGSSGYIFVKQDATGGRTFALPSQAKTPGGRTIAQATGANSLSMITFYVVDSNTVVINYIGNFS